MAQVPILETSEDILAACQRRLAPSQSALKAIERADLMRSFGADLASLSDAVAAVELLIRYASPGHQLGLGALFANLHIPPIPKVAE